MDAAQRIIQQIEQEGTESIQAYQTERQAEIDSECEKEKQQIIAHEEKKIAMNTQRIQKETKLALERNKAQKRQQLLSYKQELLQQLFDELLSKMNDWDVESFQEYVTDRLKNLPVQGSMDIVLGEYSSDKINQEWLDQLQLPQQSFRLATEKIPHQGGFVVRQEKLEYNFLFRTLVQDIQETQGYQIAEELFSGGD